MSRFTASFRSSSERFDAEMRNSEEQFALDFGNLQVAGGTYVDVDPALTEGTKIATITVDDEPTELYAPTPIEPPVASVNGKTGAVELDAADVGALSDDTPIPAKTSDLLNDSGFINAGQAPVQSVNGKTGAVSLSASDVGALPDSTTIPSKTSDLVNDSGYITSAPVSSVNGKTGTVVLDADDVGALPDSTVIPTVPEDVSAFNNDAGYITANEPLLYAGAPASGGNANKANAILYGTVDGTSTSTVFTATVAGLTVLTDGTAVMLHNGVVTSASGFTVNINNLGAKPCYNNMALSTKDTTIFNVNYTMLFVYSTELDDGNGGWWIYRGYNSDNNTIGYQLRTNSTALPATDKGYRYRLWFTSADGSGFVPANTSTSTNATAKRTPTTRAINPFGPILYYAATTAISAAANTPTATMWGQYGFSLGYSFNNTGAALTLTFPAPVYIKCAPQTDGSAIIDPDTPYVQALPTTNDGKIYIFLGVAYSATNVELYQVHQVYYHNGTGIRLWTGG